MSDRSIPEVEARPYLMHNQVQHYEWGTHDQDAYIPALLGIAPIPGKPYAELWMGAHPKAPSAIVVDGKEIALDQWINAHPLELLGTAIVERFGHNLPFLFKVLAAGKALSIQAHPNRAQAIQLRARNPQHYPDRNHKPEIAIAIDSLSALMGIKPFDEMVDCLQRYPEIASFIGADIVRKVVDGQQASATEQQQLTRQLLTVIFKRSVSDARELNTAIDMLAKRLDAQKTEYREAEQLFLSLRRQYPGPDVGLFALFLMNLVHLQKGEAMYAEAGVPHAYLKGNIIECMANSDNVVRVGLTSKFKDTPALIEIMKVEPKPVEIIHADPSMEEVIYRTPAAEFEVRRLRLHTSAQRHMDTGDQPEILILTEGEVNIQWPAGQGPVRQATFHKGQSAFIPAKLVGYTLIATQPCEIFYAGIPREA